MEIGKIIIVVYRFIFLPKSYSIFYEDGLILTLDLLICNRCNGRGEFLQYKYYMNGVCFKCHGVDVIFENVYS